MASFRYAVDRGADAIELDCRLTKDGNVVVAHDDYVQFRFENGGKPACVSDMTLAEAQAIPYKDSNSNATLRMPLLKEVLVFANGPAADTANSSTGSNSRNSTSSGDVAPRRTTVFVEMKSLSVLWEAKAFARKVVDIIRETRSLNNVCVISFNPFVLYWVRHFDDSVPTCMLYRRGFLRSTADAAGHSERVPLPLLYLHYFLDPLLSWLCTTVLPDLLGCAMVGPHAATLSMEEIQAYRTRGLGVYVWVVNEKVEMEFFKNFQCSCGTDCVFPAVTSVAASPVFQ